MAGLHESIAILREVQSGKKERKALEDILEDNAMKTLLASFVHETQNRPELVGLIQLEDTLRDYLQLSPNERAQIEEVRQQSPEFMQGEFVDSPVSFSKKPKNLSECAFELFRRIASQNGIAKVVDYYIQHEPTSSKGIVSLTSWFTQYNPTNAENLMPTKDGKTENLGTPPGNKYYEQHNALKKKNATKLDFEEWIESQLSEDVRGRLERTPYYRNKKSA